MIDEFYLIVLPFTKVKQYAFSDTENNMTYCIGVC